MDWLDNDGGVQQEETRDGRSQEERNRVREGASGAFCYGALWWTLQFLQGSPWCTGLRVFRTGVRGGDVDRICFLKTNHIRQRADQQRRHQSQCFNLSSCIVSPWNFSGSHLDFSGFEPSGRSPSCTGSSFWCWPDTDGGEKKTHQGQKVINK